MASDIDRIKDWPSKAIGIDHVLSLAGVAEFVLGSATLVAPPIATYVTVLWPHGISPAPTATRISRVTRRTSWASLVVRG
jgi:hypothetical protein